MSLIKNQMRYGQIKAVNFTINQWNHSWHNEGNSVITESFFRILKNLKTVKF